MAQMTGWRIGELLALRWVDVDLEAGTAVTRYADNKGGRSENIALHPVVIDQLRDLRSFDDRVFPWNKDRRDYIVNSPGSRTPPEFTWLAHTPGTNATGNALRHVIATGSMTNAGLLRLSTPRI